MSYADTSRPTLVEKQFIDWKNASMWLRKSRAVGVESETIRNQYRGTVRHFLAPISRQQTDLLVRFSTLRTAWEADTATLSSTTAIAMHPAYQQIIGMGPDAIPLILQELERKPGHWFWALKSITGEDPVLPEHRGQIAQMTESWLKWGDQQGYLPE